MTYRYYLVYRYGESFGAEYIKRDSPLDNEFALIQEHERLERQFQKPVVIIDWKRID